MTTMHSEITLVDDGEDPTVVWASSRSAPGHFYRIDNAHDLFPHCNCEAGRHGRDCSHIDALFQRELAKEGEPA